MNNRAYGFAALLAVIGVSIIFGMVLGTKLNAPRTVLAAPGGTLHGSSSPIQLMPAATSSGLQDFADIVERSLPAVVGITNTQLISRTDQRLRRDPLFRWFFGDPPEPDRRGPPEVPRRGFGSGFIVSPEGYILTNNHVVEDAERIVVMLEDGERVEAEVIGTDPAIDLALLKIDPQGKRLPVLPLGNSESLRVGQWVIAIGNPLEFEHTVTVGVVSAKDRQLPIGDTDISLAQFIQTDAAINFGNSGGPLLDAAGNVVGINTAISRGNLAEGIGFALPINEARQAMTQLLKSGKVHRGFLGIVLADRGLNKTAAEYYGLPDTNGAIVQGVNAGEPADKAGLIKGDVIRKVDGDVVKDNRDLIQKISSRRPGEKVKLEIFRNGKTLTRTALLMEREEGLMAQRSGSGEGDSEEPEETAEASGLGVTVENLTPSLRRRMDIGEDVTGVLVVDVDFNSSVADDGIVPNAVISSINDRPVRNVSDWNRVVEDLRPGAAIKIEVVFGERSRYIFMKVPKDK